MKRILSVGVAWLALAVVAGAQVPPTGNFSRVTVNSLARVQAGSGAPEGAETAPAGSVYLRTDGTIYVKASGAGNTGWTAIEGTSATTLSRATITATTAYIVGAATTSGIRLDLNSGTLEVREGDDSAYGPMTVGALTSAAAGTMTGQWTFSNATYPVVQITRTSSQTGLPLSALEVRHSTSGNMADGFGAQLTFAIRDDAAVDNYIGNLWFVRAGADNTGDFIVSPYAAGSATTRLRVTSGGNIGITATGRVYLDGTAATGDSYLVESSANTVDIVAGGTTAIRTTSTVTTFGTSTITLPANSTVNSGAIVSALVASGSGGDAAFRYTSSQTSILEGLSVVNTNTGTGALARIVVGNDTSATALTIAATSSTYLGPSYLLSNSAMIRSNLSGGLGLGAIDASGDVRIYAGGTASTDLVVTFQDDLTAVFASQASFAGDIALAATERIYLDGVGLSGNTYLVESSADVIGMVAGGTTSLEVTLTDVNVLRPFHVTTTNTTSTVKAPVFVQNNATSVSAGQGVGYWMQLAPTSGGACNGSNPVANDFVGFYACMESVSGRDGATHGTSKGIWGANYVLTATNGYDFSLQGVEVDIQNETSEATAVPAAFAASGKVGYGVVLARNTANSSDGSAAFASHINGSGSTALWKYGFEAHGTRTAAFYARKSGNTGDSSPASAFFDDTNSGRLLYTTGDHTTVIEVDYAASSNSYLFTAPDFRVMGDALHSGARGGFIAIGKNNVDPSHALDIGSTVDTLIKLDYNGGSDPNTHVAFYRSASIQGSITTTGGTTAYNTTSDYRLKVNVSDVDDDAALAAILALRPVSYAMAVQPDRMLHGFLAHEVQAVIPSAVFGAKDAVNDDGTIKAQQLDLSKLVPDLVGAVQALEKRVATLEAGRR